MTTDDLLKIAQTSKCASDRDKAKKILNDNGMDWREEIINKNLVNSK